MSTINTGGTAFPMQDPQAIHAYAIAAIEHIPGDNTDERDRVYMAARAQAIGGMTLRDYFAAKALCGIEASQGNSGNFISTVEKVAARAYELADTVRKMVNSKRLPKYDVDLSKRTRGWKTSTLRAAGVDVGAA